MCKIAFVCGYLTYSCHGRRAWAPSDQFQSGVLVDWGKPATVADRIGVMLTPLETFTRLLLGFNSASKHISIPSRRRPGFTERCKLHRLSRSPRACATPSTTIRPERWYDGLPFKHDSLDKEILDNALPSIANLLVIPLVGIVDTFWIGRMGDALALAGQGAANQIFFSTWFLIAFIPTITAPLVAKAAGSGDLDGARARVCEALFLANVLGALGTLLLVVRPSIMLSLVLPAGAPATEHAIRYLRLRSLSLIPTLIATIGSSAFRGLLDTVTPLKVSLAENALNIVLDPIAIFGAKMGVAGAAIATVISEVCAGVAYVFLLTQRNLLRLRSLLQPPKLSALLPLIKNGFAMLLRQVFLNVAFVAATRMTQAMDTTGLSAAVYTITNQVYVQGIVVMVAMQGVAATLVPAALSRGTAISDGSSNSTEGGILAARRVADRIIGWSTLFSISIAALQALVVPYLAPVFSTLPEVRQAVVVPALASSLVQLINGPVFAGEGIMMGVGAFGALAAITSVGCGVMLAGLAISAKLGLGVSSVWFSFLAFHIIQVAGTMYHHLKLGPLARGHHPGNAEIVK